MNENTSAPLASALIMGAPQSGKTYQLAQRALTFAQNNAGITLFICQSETNAQEAMGLLAHHPSVRAATWQEIALEIMDEPAARALYHREPRLLEPYEDQFLQEDIKVSTRRNKRLRKVVYYLYSQWAGFRDQEEQLVTWEESDVMERIHDMLAFTGGILPCELSNFALNTLRQNPEAAQRHTCSAVFVDNFELLNRATQLLVRFIAKDLLVVSANQAPRNTEFEQFPHYQGVQELLSDLPTTKIEVLEGTFQGSCAAQTAQLLSRHEALSPLATIATNTADQTGVFPQDFANIHVEDSMENELRALAKECLAAKESGKSILIVGTDRIWQSNVVANLSKLGLSFDTEKRKLSAKGFANEEKCPALMRDIQEKLLANPQDSVAWRNYVGIGDHVANTVGIDIVLKAAAGRNMRFVDALEALAQDEFEGLSKDDPMLQRLVDTYLARRQQLQNYQVKRNIQAKVSKESRPAADVLICSPQQALHHRADVVIFGGFVDGLFPDRSFVDPTSSVGNAHKRAEADYLRTLYTLAGCANERMAFTAFTSCSLSTAENLGLHVVKNGLRNGVRMATIAPSEFLSHLEG